MRVEAMAVHFQPVDPANEAMWMGTGLIDEPAVPAPLTQRAAEELQIDSFLAAIGRPRGPGVEARPGADPPDRVVTIGGRSWSLELTALTIDETRGDLARARQVGRRLHAALQADSLHAHLIGRKVLLALPSDGRASLPRSLAPTVKKLAGLLTEDRGCVGDGVDFSAGPPAHWPNDRGFYGEHGPFNVQVNGDGTPGAIEVVSTAQLQVSRSQARAILARRMNDKDRAENEILVMSCCLPDKHGHVCRLESFMFDFLKADPGRLDLATEPKHLQGVALHVWDTEDWIEIWRAPNAAVPWYVHPKLIR
jgi:hypothetical protein